MERKAILNANDSHLSIRQQCQLLKLNRSSLYYQRKPEDADNVELMRLLDEEYTRHPFKGVVTIQQNNCIFFLTWFLVKNCIFPAKLHLA